ncbi:MAG TPA: hypothetical protein VN768_00310 [Acidimicrobiales bacterium]|nr:hypothetical protein [Acidimicrobiales bacterium]
MSPPGGGGWSIDRRADTARALHDPWPPPAQRGRRTAGLCSVRGPRAVVLGSTQSTDVVAVEQARRHSVDVVRRTSGGGAVYVAPDAQVWLDVWLPRDDPLWDDDVVRSSWWLGETWTRALDGLGAPGLGVHRRGAARTEWSDVVCFAGVGPGEVTAGTRKVVGVAQRRTREGARLHSMAPLTWDPEPLLTVLALDDDKAGQARLALDDVATGLRGVAAQLGDLDAPRAVASVEDALLDALP